MDEFAKCKEDNDLKDKKIKDLLNWVKSDLAQETNIKLGKTATPYRTEKIRFLNKLKQALSLIDTACQHNVIEKTGTDEGVCADCDVEMIRTCQPQDWLEKN
tara:strand:- start:4639 stop:4944 length:306 start_codon:yes stop_codon:yes gene_type:complete